MLILNPADMCMVIFHERLFLIYLVRRQKLASMHVSQLGLSVDTLFAHVRCESTKLWPINGHIFILCGQFLGYR